MKEADEIARAIQALEAQRAALGERVVEAAQASLRERLASLEEHAPPGRQRRLVTVLFVDIANSTLLSQGLEPEEVQEAVGGAFKRLSVPVETHGGQVTQFMGDGFTAVFGLKRIHENDARQAVRAGLVILAEARACADELERRYGMRGFALRLGINTGRVVAGRFSEAQSPVMGLTVVLAARMEEAAPPGTLLISQFTHQHVRGAFEVEALAPVEAKGFPQPVAVYRVLAARPRTFRTVTRGVEGIETGMVGRQAELHELQEALARTIQSRRTQLITILGEAGVGKSRLLYEFDRLLAHASHAVVAFKARASPQMMSLPFGLLREAMSYRLGILTTDSAGITRQRLVDEFSTCLDSESQVKAHFAGALLGFDFYGSPYLKGVEDDPERLSERGQQYLIQYFQSVASRSATLLMLDDVHWADDPSLSFVARLVRECPQLPLLVLCLARSSLAERFPGWGVAEPQAGSALPDASPSPCSQQLNLCPLSPQASQELLGAILRNVEAFPDELRQRLLTKAGGNPFYLEEYIQSLVDARVIRKVSPGEVWRLNEERLGALELPATLVALLEARLDSLNAAQRALVQQAAVIGPVFWRSALEAVRGDKPVHAADLDLLSRRGFIIPRETSTFAGTEEYHFHHGLLRDVAYQALFKSDRLAYHGLAAGWLVKTTLDSGRAGEFAPVIAEHYEQAGEPRLAAGWYTQSGTRARSQGAPAQAYAFFGRALELFSSGPPASGTDPDVNLRWQALVGHDEVLGLLGDTGKRLADDLALVAFAGQVGNDHYLAEACYHQGYYFGERGQYPQALEAYDRGLEAARRAQDLRYEALLLGLKVVAHVRLGDLEAAAQTSALALRRADETGDDYVRTYNIINVSTFYNETGDMARAAQLLDQQVEINHRTGNIEAEVAALLNLGYTYILLGLPEEAVSSLQECMDKARSIGHSLYRALAQLDLALAYLRQGNPSAALGELEQCLPLLQAMNDKFSHAVGLTYTALARERIGLVREALVDFTQAATSLKELGRLGYAADAQAGVVRCLLAMNELESAQAHAAPLWDYLMGQDKAGMEFPILAYETCADMFSAAGQASLARRAVFAGYGELLLRVGRISLAKWRQSFLERVPEHCRIQARWQEYTKSSE